MKLSPATMGVLMAVAVVVCGATRANATLITAIPVNSGPDVVLSSLAFDEGEASLVLTSYGLQLNIVHFADGSYSSTSLTNSGSNLSWLGAGPDFGGFPTFGPSYSGQSSSSAPGVGGGAFPLGVTGGFPTGGSLLSQQPDILTTVPEPSTMALFGFGAAVVMYFSTRRRTAEAELE